MRVLENLPLKAYTTFGIDVNAQRLVEFGPDDDPAALAPLLTEPCFILGGGSNVVFTADYRGTVVKLTTERLAMCDGTAVTAWGGMVLDDLVQWTLDKGLYGLENLSAIPGTVGAAAVQNVGAYGVEAKDVVERVEAYDLLERRCCSFANVDCRFDYRQSMFKEHPGRYLILWVTFRLADRFIPNLTYKALDGLPHGSAADLRRSITDLRWSKLPRPEEHGSAGSFFKNPVVDEATYRRLKTEYPDMPDAHPLPTIPIQYKLSAGWLIDRAGWKGRQQGRAGVWPKNALVLYNAEGCSGVEVCALAQAIVADLQARFGVTLIPEAIII